MNQLLEIKLENIGRRFNRDWIFKGIDYTFQSGESYAILGYNGSGKSTFLQIINANLSPSVGKISYSLNQHPIDVEQVYKHLSLAAPYLELIEEFSLIEMIDFHFKFKRYTPGFDREKLMELLGMQPAKHKMIRYFSSGMKQRLKLALAFCADTAMLMLDEPTANLDAQGIEWYLHLVKEFTGDRLLVICSNQEHEYSFCRHQLHITDYKQ